MGIVIMKLITYPDKPRRRSCGTATFATAYEYLWYMYSQVP
jgi:hypothetical protein